MYRDWVYHYKNGVNYGYPECCVIQFCQDVVIEDEDLYSFQMRWDWKKHPLRSHPKEYPVWVPCWDCLVADKVSIAREEIHEPTSTPTLQVSSPTPSGAGA